MHHSDFFYFCFGIQVDMIKHIKSSKSKKNNAILCEGCMDLFNAFADETRQKIIMIFASKKEVCVNDIASHFTLSRPTISHHLNLLKRSKILNSRKEGKEVYYSVNKSHIKTLLASVLKDIDSCC